jgi:hypothetical protein
MCEAGQAEGGCRFWRSVSAIMGGESHHSYHTRYDALLEHFKDPARMMQAKKVYGVGMSIAVE